MEQQDAGDSDVIHIRASRNAKGQITRVAVSLPPCAWMGATVLGLTPEHAAQRLLDEASHSPRAHACALSMACAAAQGRPEPDVDSRLAIERTLAAEAADAHLRRLLIEWPPLLDFEPRHSRFAEFHRRLTLDPHTDGPAAFALGGELLDLVAREMLAGFFNQIRMPHGIGEFLERLQAGGSLGAVLSELIALGPSGAPVPKPVSMLGTLSAAAWVGTVGAWPDASFVRQPEYAGEPAETGPLARHAASALVRILLERGHRVSARLFAKAIDVGDCASRMRYPLDEEVAPLADATQVAPGVGMARVDTARGVLLCWVRLEEDRIADCAIVPAGAWNFHPDGAFCREATCPGAGNEDHDAALLRLSLLALAFDPSLPHRVELVDEHRPRKGSPAR